MNCPLEWQSALLSGSSPAFCHIATGEESENKANSGNRSMIPKLICTGKKVDPLTLSEIPLKLLSPPLKAWLPPGLAMHTTHGCATVQKLIHSSWTTFITTIQLLCAKSCSVGSHVLHWYIEIK